MSRIAADVLASAIIRTAETLGGHGIIEKRGSAMSGAIYVSVYHTASQKYDLLEPAPQASLDREFDTAKRYFSVKLGQVDRFDILEFVDKETAFDPDFWLVEVEGVRLDQLSNILPIV